MNHGTLRKLRRRKAARQAARRQRRRDPLAGLFHRQIRWSPSSLLTTPEENAEIYRAFCRVFRIPPNIFGITSVSELKALYETPHTNR